MKDTIIIVFASILMYSTWNYWKHGYEQNGPVINNNQWWTAVDYKADQFIDQQLEEKAYEKWRQEHWDQKMSNWEEYEKREAYQKWQNEQKEEEEQIKRYLEEQLEEEKLKQEQYQYHLDLMKVQTKREIQI